MMILPVLTKTLTAKDRGQPRLSDVSLMPSLIRSICVSNATSMASPWQLALEHSSRLLIQPHTPLWAFSVRALHERTSVCILHDKGRCGDGPAKAHGPL